MKYVGIKRKDYKEIFLIRIMKNRRIRGQATLFVIVALVIVALIVLGVIFYPRITNVFEGELSPSSYLKDCIGPEIENGKVLLSKQGGYDNPEGYVLYGGEKIKYLCYTDDFYETCVVQQPMIKNHFEIELNRMIKGRAENCANNLIKEYESRGYDVSSSDIDSSVSISPGNIKVIVNAPMSITKDTTQTFKKFEVEMKSEMYDLLFTASSIIDFESGLGDSAPELYLQYYPNLKIEKTKLSDGTTVYKLSNVITGESFVFASRSLAWPAGYGVEEI